MKLLVLTVVICSATADVLRGRVEEVEDLPKNLPLFLTPERDELVPAKPKDPLILPPFEPVSHGAIKARAAVLPFPAGTTLGSRPQQTPVVTIKPLLSALGDKGKSLGPFPPNTGKPVVPFPPNTAKPVVPFPPDTAKPVVPFPPNTGKPVVPFPPNTGKPVVPFPPNTGKPVVPFPPNTVKPVVPFPPNTGKTVVPFPSNTGKPVVPTPPNIGKPVVPFPPNTGKPVTPFPLETGKSVVPFPPNTGKPVVPFPPNTGKPVVPTPPNIGKPVVPFPPNTGKPVTPFPLKTGKSVVPFPPNTGKPVVPFPQQSVTVVGSAPPPSLQFGLNDHNSQNPVHIPILRSSSELTENGYNYNYQSANGISVQEEGTLKKIKDVSALVSAGQYQYTAPDGTPVLITYVADENGFQPQGDVIPVAPPVPGYVTRARAYQQARPEATSHFNAEKKPEGPSQQ